MLFSVLFERNTWGTSHLIMKANCMAYPWKWIASGNVWVSHRTRWRFRIAYHKGEETISRLGMNWVGGIAFEEILSILNSIVQSQLDPSGGQMPALLMIVAFIHIDVLQKKIMDGQCHFWSCLSQFHEWRRKNFSSLITRGFSTTCSKTLAANPLSHSTMRFVERSCPSLFQTLATCFGYGLLAT